MYDNKFFKHPGKLKMHSLGPYVIVHITDAGTVKLQRLDGTYVTGMVNGSHLKPYYVVTTCLAKVVMREEKKSRNARNYSVARPRRNQLKHRKRKE